MDKKNFLKQLKQICKDNKIVILTDIQLGNADEFSAMSLTLANEIQWPGGWNKCGPFIQSNTTPKIDQQELDDREKKSYGKKFMTSTFREFRNPIDGKEIASTKQLRDFERAHGVKQAGNDLIKTKEERIDYDRKQRTVDTTGIIDAV